MTDDVLDLILMMVVIGLLVAIVLTLFAMAVEQRRNHKRIERGLLSDHNHHDRDQ